ncbi:MAG TPA: hypothetical protein PL172_13890 [Thermomicrobiales bacterium]|nr:hypothetical protein [Thermomicrobiales bacterium]
MLAPANFSEIVGRPVDDVRHIALGQQESAHSGSALSVIETGSLRLILKRVAHTWDYFMRVSDDRHGREAALWAHGLLDRLPSEMVHAYLATARDDEGWAVLMRDVADTLLPSGKPIPPSAHERIITGLAAMHAAYWDIGPDQFLCDPWHHYHVVSPDAAQSDPGEHGALNEIIPDGWEKLTSLLDPGIAREALALANDPAPLVAALASLPQTLAHADARPANIGIEDGRVLLIDWALAGRDVAGLDIVWYIAGSADHSSISREASLALYERALATCLGPRFDPASWATIRDLSLLGGLLRHGWIAARVAFRGDEANREGGRADVAWWEQAAKAGLARM